MYPSPPTDIPLVSKTARAPTQTDTHYNVHGQVATVEVVEGRCQRSNAQAVQSSTKKNTAQVSNISYLGCKSMSGTYVMAY